ncbi:yjeF C-terminal region, hydroxyethylthiazole kinase-related/yjeF N-terminal region [Robiginitalea myxolifaciens]|uniref:Bifunctional NAD(P)H-hydrate repair enzyme n=1 Tax=Robiginitalea myxolifaciens TaxID=400055 RepID=A0A1I6H3C4_9FLAO|nr:NAD(P)H-hydrate dehydratase [Robiginitalea myxolifaciens]SFR48908.1 yjeF C-terminal region, hydroxyethylthiazole kinase-related/yjeF N-terminal region [Robiginitalea myxolifaciens]
MKILSRQQIYKADKETTRIQQISSLELMERAATRAFEWIHQRLQGSPVPIYLLCGIGNNGGDGLVIARHLAEHGYHIEVFIVDYHPKRSPDFLENLQALKQRKVWPTTLESGQALPAMDPQGILVDAIFGIGLSRVPDPWMKSVIDQINSSGLFVLAIDLPSGMPADFSDFDPAQNGLSMVHAQHTLTFGAPKLTFFLPETGSAVGQWTVLDIGLAREYTDAVQTEFSGYGAGLIRSLYRPRQKFTHKGSFGHLWVVGGSYGTMGALQLAARGGLRSGAGKVTAWTPQCGVDILQGNLPEVMVRTGKGKKQLTDFPQAGKFTLVAGMGLGTAKVTADAFVPWLKQWKQPVVLDADALNILSQNPEGFNSVPAGSILTPHPGEFARMVGNWTSDADKLEKARNFVKQYSCILVLKGAHTLVLDQHHGFFNTSGNPGMATAGSGDVLAGMIGGLLAQGYEPVQAALAGVYLHGLSADIGVQKLGYEALTAGDIISGIGPAFVSLFQTAESGPPQEEAAKEE